MHCTDETSHSTAVANQSAIRSLAGRGVTSLTVLSPSDSLPSGCAVFGVSSSAAVYLTIAGRVDIDAEITKAKAKMQKASDGVKKQKKVLDAEGFETKVSSAVLETEKEKLRDLQAEVGNYEKSVEQFEKLKLEG